MKSTVGLVRGAITIGLLFSGVFQVVPARAAAFTAGDLVVYRVGSGTGSLASTGNPVYLEEYSPTGNQVQVIAVPTVANGANKSLIAAGNATSEGFLNRSEDGRYLILTGYDATLGGGTSLSGTAGTSVPRTVGRVDVNGNVDTSTALTDFASGGNPRSATSVDGTAFWAAGGAGGLRYATIGSSISTQILSTPANLRVVTIFAGQMYVSGPSSGFRLGAAGVGIPTNAATFNDLPGYPSSSGSPYAFFFADLSANVPGVDTVYVADDSAGLLKYSFDGTSWNLTSTIGSAADVYRGLTGVQNGTNVTLYATEQNGELVSLVDSSGYGAAMTATPTVLATAVANTAYRGVAFAPIVPGALTITTAVLTGANMVLGGSGGTDGGIFRVLTATNVSAPLVNWLPVMTNNFDVNGAFLVTNPVNFTEPQRYFLLKAP